LLVSFVIWIAMIVLFERSIESMIEALRARTFKLSIIDYCLSGTRARVIECDKRFFLFFLLTRRRKCVKISPRLLPFCFLSHVSVLFRLL
jgi:hypothetical protein